MLSRYKLFLWCPVSYTLCQNRPTNNVFLLTYLSEEIFPHPSNPYLLFIWSFLQYPCLSDGFRRLFLSYLVYFVRRCCNTWSCAFLIHNEYLWLKRNSKFENALRNSNCNSNVQKSVKNYKCWMKHPTKPAQHGKFIFLRRNILDEILFWNKLHPTSSNMTFFFFFKT